MYIYTAYNLCIHSEIPLPELVISEGTPDVIVRLGNLNNILQETINRGDRILGELEGVGRLLIEEGRFITIEPNVGIEESRLSPYILGAGMSVILRQRGLLVLHASSVAINNQAVAFMGGSGWGKSTLAAAFHAQGNDVLTDDVMPIQLGKGHPIVIPAFPQFKLCPEVADSLGKDRESLSPLFHKARKLSYKFTQGFQKTPLPLRRIYILDAGTQHQISKLQPQDAFIQLVSHTRAMGALISPEFVSDHMRQCTSLIQNVVFCRFIRKPALDELSHLVKLVEEDLIQKVPDASLLCMK
jgi:hypothetical protein